MLHIEQDISLEQVLEKLPPFHQILVVTSWMCFALEPCRDNKQWVREFYMNISAIKLSKPIVRIQSKVICVRDEEINDWMSIRENLRTRNMLLVAGWLQNYVRGGSGESILSKHKTMIFVNDFTAEARIQLIIICSRVSLSINMINIHVMWSQMVPCILDNIPLKVFFVSKINAYKS